ncbi:hypothetical protein quinque_008912 [Culex quinquefasciatus]
MMPLDGKKAYLRGLRHYDAFDLDVVVEAEEWNLDFDGIALMWRGGCIIRSVFLENIRNSFVRNPAMSHLLLDNFFKNAIVKNQQ